MAIEIDAEHGLCLPYFLVTQAERYHFGALYLIDVLPISVADTVKSLDPIICELVRRNQEAVALADNPTAARVPPTPSAAVCPSGALSKPLLVRRRDFAVGRCVHEFLGK